MLSGLSQGITAAGGKSVFEDEKEPNRPRFELGPSVKHSLLPSHLLHFCAGYWKIRGLAEASRMMLHYTETPFDDTVYTIANNRVEWKGKKYRLVRVWLLFFLFFLKKYT